MLSLNKSIIEKIACIQDSKIVLEFEKLGIKCSYCLKRLCRGVDLGVFCDICYPLNIKYKEPEKHTPENEIAASVSLAMLHEYKCSGSLHEQNLFILKFNNILCDKLYEYCKEKDKNKKKEKGKDKNKKKDIDIDIETIHRDIKSNLEQLTKLLSVSIVKTIDTTVFLYNCVKTSVVPTDRKCINDYFGGCNVPSQIVNLFKIYIQMIKIRSIPITIIQEMMYNNTLREFINFRYQGWKSIYYRQFIDDKMLLDNGRSINRTSKYFISYQYCLCCLQKDYLKEPFLVCKTCNRQMCKNCIISLDECVGCQKQLCIVCGAPGKKCSRCLKIAYCSRKCQEGDWIYHKIVCQKAN
jgi:hypothetical protein